MNSIGDLYIQLHATARGLADDIRNDLRRAQGGLTAQAVAMGTLIADGIKAGLSMAGNFFGEQLKNASKFSAEMESTTALFEVLLGSVEKAKQAIADIRIIDQQSPLNFSQLTQSGQMLLAMGESAEKLTDDLRLLGTVSLGNSERMGRLVYAFGQIQSLGRLAGTELRQLTELGFNPLEYISKRTGESLRELSQRMSDGKLSFGEVRLAMLDAASAGGRFNGALERMEQTFEGKMAKLTGGLRMLMIDIGDGLNASLKPIMEAIIKEFGGIKPMAIAIGQAIGGWVTGLYQALGGIKGIAQGLMEVYATLSSCAQIVGVVVSYAKTGLEIIGAAGTQFTQLFQLALKSAEVFFSGIGILVKKLIANILDAIFKDINDIKNQILTMIDAIATRIAILAVKIQKALNPLGKAADYDKQINDIWNEGKAYKPSDTIPDLPTGDDPNSPTSLLFPQGSNRSIVDMDMSGLESAAEDYASSVTESMKLIGQSAEESNAKLSEIFEEGFIGDRIREEYAKAAEEMAKSTAGAVQQQKHSFEDLKADAIKTAHDQTEALKGSDDEKVKSAKEAADKRLKIEKDFIDEKIRAEEDYMSDVQARLDEITRATAQMYEEFRSMNRDATSDIVTAWITGTGKISDIVSQWANSMIRQFVQVGLFGNGSSPGNGSFAGLLGSMGGLFGSTAKPTGAVAQANTTAGVSTSGWISAIGSLIGGFFADGGRPPMGKVSVVGENGPELFVPDSAGRVIPNNQAASFLAAPAASGGGGEPPMIFNFSQHFSSGVTQAELAGAMDDMMDATKSAVLEGVQRGGNYRRGMQT